MESPEKYHLRHRVTSCGYSQQECPLFCDFRLPSALCSESDFKQHLLGEHSTFFGMKALARHSETSSSLGWVFDHTDLTLERLRGLQAAVRELCRSSFVRKEFNDHYGYLEVTHLPNQTLYYACSRCVFATDKLAEIKRHLVFAHVAVEKTIPEEDVALLSSASGHPRWRLTTPRKLKTPPLQLRVSCDPVPMQISPLWEEAGSGKSSHSWLEFPDRLWPTAEDSEGLETE